MTRPYRRTAIAAALASTAALAACTVEPAPVVYRPAPPVVYTPAPAVVVHPPVPPLRYEIVPPPPPGRYAWRPGHWEWNGSGYYWIHGHYVMRQPGWHNWVHGYWGPSGIWISGHWG